MPEPYKESTICSPDTSNMRWQFIDSSNNSRTNLRQVKRHVMQEYMRQKKGSTRQSESEEEVPRPPPRRGRPRKNRIEKRKSSEAKPPPKPSITSSESTIMRTNGTTQCYIEPMHESWSALPATSLPMAVQTSNATLMSPFQAHVSQTGSFGSPLDYTDILFYGHSNMANFDSLAPWPSTTNSLSNFEGDMIRTCGGAASFANLPLGMPIDWQDHRLFGDKTHGLSFFYENSPTSSAVLSASAPILPPPFINSMPPPPPSISSSSDTSSPSVELPSDVMQHSSICPIHEVRLHCEEFLNFLRRCEQLALFQRNNPAGCDLSRHTAVQETSLLFRILASVPGAQFTSPDDQKQMVAHLTTLVMLNAALWDYKYTPLYAGHFLRTLEQAIIQSEACMRGSVEAVLQTLLECNDGYTGNWAPGDDGALQSVGSELVQDFTQYSTNASSTAARPWYAGRILSIAKRLGADSWNRVVAFLFSCLTLHLSEPTVFLWETDLRREILDTPLTSYATP